jgi:hypothetical protein
MLVHSSVALAPSAPALIQPAAVPVARRLLFFDNLRVVAIAVVILQHVGQT